MLIFKVLTNTSFLRLLTLFFNATSLTLFHDSISVLAGGPDLRYEGPETSDYPNDDDIREAYIGVEPGKTVVFAGLGRNDATEAQEFAKSRKRTWVYDAFRSSDGQPFVFRNGRSARWYGDFVERFSRVWLAAASGLVWLVTNFPDGPGVMPSCSLWWYVELPVLKLNDGVQIIVRVNRYKLWNMNIYLDKRENDPFDPNRRESDPPRLGGENEGGIFGAGIGAGTGLIGGGLGAGAGTGAGTGVGQGIVPGLSLPSSGDDGSKDDIYIEDGVKTDVLDNTIGLLPSVNPPAVADEQEAMAGTDGALDVFRRQSNPVYYDWSDEPDFPTFPGDPRLATYTVGVTDSQYFDMAKGGAALIQVTQYAKSFPPLHPHWSDNYKLDLWIRNPANHNQLLGSVVGADAPPGHPIKVVSLLPYALFVWTGAADTDPLHFRYGEFGAEWSSDDASACHLDPWTPEKREGTCHFQYG